MGKVRSILATIALIAVPIGSCYMIYLSEPPAVSWKIEEIDLNGDVFATHIVKRKGRPRVYRRWGGSSSAAQITVPCGWNIRVSESRKARQNPPK